VQHSAAVVETGLYSSLSTDIAIVNKEFFVKNSWIRIVIRPDRHQNLIDWFLDHTSNSPENFNKIRS